MKTKHAVWLAFFLNLGYAIVEPSTRTNCVCPPETKRAINGK